MLSGVGYTGKYGSFHLLDLNLQSNTVTAILHNMVAWEISQLDPAWTFHPKGGATPDLTNAKGKGVQVKVTSDKKIKGNYVSAGTGFYLAVKYQRTPGPTLRAVEITEIRMGQLAADDWDRKKGTQWAILKADAEAKMQKLYP